MPTNVNLPDSLISAVLISPPYFLFQIALNAPHALTSLSQAAGAPKMVITQNVWHHSEFKECSIHFQTTKRLEVDKVCAEVKVQYNHSL